MKITRRDWLCWGAGAAAGLMVTPVPWKVLDDVSIWSQNWSWIPQPSRGPVEVKQSYCTLCRNGCALRVRMAAGSAVGVAGVGGNPVTRGALCPLAFGAHQLNWHPRRLKTVLHRGGTSTWNEAQTSFAKACSEGPLIVVDAEPGRAASGILASFAQKHGGTYNVFQGPESRALSPYERWTGVPAESLGYDIENARTIVSFGAPLLDGWGVPGRFTRMWAERAAGASDPALRLIQVDSALSRTAGRAWKSITIREGSESALASGLARASFEQNLVPARAPVPAMTMEDCTMRTGLGTETIRLLARTIVEQTPALVIAADDSPPVAALNVVLGALGTRGGIVQRSTEKRVAPESVSEIANARVVLLDASVPWDYAPQTDAEVFRFAAWDGGGSKAEWLLPAPGFLEELSDLPTPPTLSVETYAIAQNLMKSGREVLSAAQFLCGLDSGLPTVDQVIRARCEGIFRKRSGRVYDGNPTLVREIESPQKFEERLRNGASWMDEPRNQRLVCELKEWPEGPGEAAAHDWASAWQSPVLPPLASKLYAESSLRQAPIRRNA